MPAPSHTEPPTEAMLAANALIRQHGANAEEYASQQLWNCQQNADDKNSTQWRLMLQAIKLVRQIREDISRGS